MNDNNFGVKGSHDGFNHEQRIAIAKMQDKMIMAYLNGTPIVQEQKTSTVTLDAESLTEIKKLKEDLAPMNKALKYKAENVTKKNTKEAIRESIRARKLLKSGS